MPAAVEEPKAAQAAQAALAAEQLAVQLKAKQTIVDAHRKLRRRARSRERR